MLSYTMMSTLISITMLLILNIVSKKSFYDREKTSPFECGFEPKNLARLPFSLQFFLIAIIFVIFDVELTLFLPFIIIYETSNYISIKITMTMFILILLFGLLHEYKQGSLNWVK
uniref:NADH-ubiquinone oxidoreductase chain 3 n=1 Tax=Pityophthorus pubescens TaxID=471227 RepID=A0A343A6H7_9CUCU|nr:NADH dehydrogenase subunit 3 [Pityophthorus pubescens]AOY40156.1 NADH dehydrogenase subunit 3 [Pityophthorus pubescens]